MAKPSLSEILADLDTSALTVDSSGQVGSDDPAVAKKLAQLREVLASKTLKAADPNGVQCLCGGSGGQGSGCSV